MNKMKKVFSFLKLFEHEQFEQIKITNLYNDIKNISVSNAGMHGDVLFTRIDTSSNKTIIIAYRHEDHKTWLRIHSSIMSEHSYAWRTRSHSIHEGQWDMVITVPEIEAGLDTSRYSWTNATMETYPQLFGFIADTVSTKEAFKQIINASIIEVKETHEVFFQPYTGQLDGKRLGDYTFIYGQDNGMLLKSARRVVADLDKRNRNASVHLLPYIGTLIATADFDTLNNLLAFIDDCHLTHYPSHILSQARAEIIIDLLDKIKHAGEERLKELMKDHVQTVNIKQLTSDQTIQEHVATGARVNLLLDLNEMKWVD